MSKFLYRLWIPQARIHGSDFNKICPKCQDKIEAEIEDGFYLPTTVAIDTSVGFGLKFGFSMHQLELCEDCAKAFKQWLDSQDYFHFNNDPIELWRNKKDEEASE